MLHAHVDLENADHAHHHEQVRVHGGHDHQLGSIDVQSEHHGSGHGDYVVELNSTPEHTASTLAWAWIALPAVFIILFVCLSLVGFSSRRQRREARGPQQFPPWPPPLRGPPVSI